MPCDRTRDDRGGRPRPLSDEPLSRVVNLLPTPTAMDSGGSGGSSPTNVTLTDAVVRTDLGRRPNPRHWKPLGEDQPAPADLLERW
jgi:hypothetical protein